MRTFVMGDLHGTYKALLQCLQQCNFNYSEDMLIQLGDVTDGYDEVFQCVEELLKIKNLVALKGNHDQWFNEFIATGVHGDNWAQGGKATAISYLRLTDRAHMITPVGQGYLPALLTGDIPETHQRFFQQQQLYYIDEHNNCFVHAGFNRHLPFKEQPEYLYYWDRDLWTEALSYESFRKSRNEPAFRLVTSFNNIFIGHTSTMHWKKAKPMKAGCIFNLDTGAGHNGKLTIMEISTKKYWQSEPVKKLYTISYR